VVADKFICGFEVRKYRKIHVYRELFKLSALAICGKAKLFIKRFETRDDLTQAS